MEIFCKNLPKIELHAHLNGSLSSATLKKLGCLTDSISEYQKLNTLLETTPETLNDCFPVFKIAHNATNTKENVYTATQSVIKDFHDDNVVYLELRTTPRNGDDFDKETYIETVIKAICDYKNCSGKTESMIIKLILCIDRRHDIRTSSEMIDLIIKMKGKYPNVIKGVDLCGNPNEGKFFRGIFEKARENGLKITLHCAEVANSDEVMEMFEFKPDRIGHGTCIHGDFGGNEMLWWKFQDLRIPVECCLTSNVICGTSNGFEGHHIKELIKNKIPFCICTDDKGVFNTDLSCEYFLLSKHFGLDKMDLWKICFESVDLIFDSDEVKRELKKVMMNWMEKNFD
nr:adenosine deaminase-like protein [Onthophagus taurus]